MFTYIIQLNKLSTKASVRHFDVFSETFQVGTFPSENALFVGGSIRCF